MKRYSPQELRAAAVFASEELVSLNVFLAEHEKVEARFSEHMQHIEALLGKGLEHRARIVLDNFALPMFRVHPMLRCYPSNLERLSRTLMAVGHTKEDAIALCLAPEPPLLKRSKQQRYRKERLYGYRLPSGTS